MYGPFENKPFDLHIYPLMTSKKQNPNKKRTTQVHDVIKKHHYLGLYFSHHYPSLDHITETLRNLGPQALTHKIDISRDFRHLTVDPGDLLRLKYQD